MINAMLAGRKTQTRRLIATTKADVAPGQILIFEGPRFGGTAYRFDPRYAAGDRLYVREEWKSTPAYDDLKPSDMGGDEPIYYPADGATFNWAEADGHTLGRRRPGMHMPRWASRLTLHVEGVRVERLQAISDEDAIAEGVTCWVCGGPVDGTSENDCACFHTKAAAVASYAVLWETLHGASSWDANPWVVAVTFRVARGNIDQVPA